MSVSAHWKTVLQHPLASAIIKKADHMNADYNKIEINHFSSITGRGIQGDMNNETLHRQPGFIHRVKHTKLQFRAPARSDSTSGTW